jgi:multiple sugar transport system permease protein
MFLGGNWQVTELRQGLPPAQFELWDVAPIPQATLGHSPTGSGGWVWVVFARDAQKRRAAIDFVRYVESTANVGRIAKATGHLPVRRSVYREFAFFREDPFLRKFGEIVEHARARPAAAIYPYLSEELQVAIGAAIDGRKTPEQAVDDAFRAVAARHEALANPAPPRVGLDPVALLPWLAALALLALSFRALGPQRRALAPWLMPALTLVALFFAYPIAELVRLAFTDLRAHGTPYRYTLAGVRAVALDPELHGMLGTTLGFVAACVLLQLAVGLGLALVLDGARRRRMRGTLLVRTTVVAAWVVPGVLVGVLWRILLVENRSGIANYLLSLAGMGPLPFLSSPGVALGSAIAANVWWGSAFSMILQYAGLLRIPEELHEAADLEGISGLRRLWLVTLPQIAPFVGLNLALITIATLNTFDLILPLTGGGPARATEVVALSMYRAAFFNLETGRAAAIALLMLALNLALALAALHVWRRTSGEGGR